MTPIAHTPNVRIVNGWTFVVDGKIVVCGDAHVAQRLAELVDRFGMTNDDCLEELWVLPPARRRPWRWWG